MRDLLSELKRRRVFRVAAVYAAVAFVVWQAADIAFPALQLPPWLVTAVVALTILGFPIALVLAWAFDLTPEGVVRTERAAGGQGTAEGGSPETGRPAASPRRWTAQRLAAVWGVAMFLALGGAFALLGSGSQRGDAAEIRSLAVLPFADLSEGRDQEYFSDGITEELLDALAKIPGLRVPARTSSFAFKGQHADVRDIARQLGVQAVLQGSVRRSGDRLRITAQLIDASDDSHLWSESYDRRLTDIFAVQDEISRAIVEALRVRLGSAPARASGATDNLRAHDFYLLGLYHWNRRHEEALLTAVRHFGSAVREDPSYARAHAGLALSYAVLPLFSLQRTPLEFGDLGRAAALRALELDPRSAEAHAALGQIAHYVDRDWAAADRSYRRALELNPGYATAHQWRGELLLALGRFEESRRSFERAHQLDPMSPVITSTLGLHAYATRDFPAAIRYYERAVQMEPSFMLGHQLLGLIHLGEGRTEAAAAEWARAAEIAGFDPDVMALLARGTRDPASRQRALAVMAHLEPTVPAATAALFYTLLGERDVALGLLERGYEERDYFMPTVHVTPAFDPLRGEPRYQELMRRMGLN